MAASSLFDLLASGTQDAPALGAPGRDWLTYGELRDHIAHTVTTMNGLGIGRGDRVAIVLPNGPDMASAFTAIGAGATTAPLNPAYRDDEFRFYLEDLNAKALVLEEGSTSPARNVADELGVKIVELIAKPDEPAGNFELIGGGNSVLNDIKSGYAQPDDTALVLHTSGTTSRPKIVPLSHANVCSSAHHIATSLALAPGDLCLNVMPLFHIHGLIAAVLSSLSAGAAVSCTPGFNALKFFQWLDDAKPTWYTAVPTMHQAILTRASRNADIVTSSKLRLIRSSSSSLPPRVMAELEQTFGSPVIEAYGMTEAAHQMASNPLPPAPRKPGTVGLAAGPDVAIMNDAGELLDTGEIGEIVIRGPNVTVGYENNAKANAEAFTHGWFRTGDQGLIDDEGYVSLTGRLKEIINRGGEKISPREVDEVLMDHPAVAQTVTFAMPHKMLGEDVAAAVVLRDGKEVDEKTLRDFARLRLAEFKVPRTIVFLDEIPKGATGKLQRIGLADKLGLA